MAVPKTTETRCNNGSVGKTGCMKTTQATLSLYPFLYMKFCEFSYEITGSINVLLKKDVGMELLVLGVALYNISCLYTAIHTPSFCGFWHRHPYIPLHIPLHFWKM